MPRPRSRVVEAIAVLLLARPMRAAEIAQVLGYPVNYVTSYLSYWRVRGLFTYENGFWKLTPEGERFAKNILARESAERLAQYAALAKSIISSSNEPISSAVNGKVVLHAPKPSSSFQQFTVELTSKKNSEPQEARYLCVEALLEAVELNDEEREVFEHMLNHYIKWGSTYTYIDSIEEALNADRAWLLRILRSLQSKGLLYIYNDRRLGTRIGLSKKVKTFLNKCLEEGYG